MLSRCITLVVPRIACHVNDVEADAQIDDDMPWINPDAFDPNNPELQEKVFTNLADRGVTIMHECKLIEIITIAGESNS